MSASREPEPRALIDMIMYVLPKALPEERWKEIVDKPQMWRPTYDELVPCLRLLGYDKAAAEAEAYRLLEAERLLRPRGRGRPKRTALENDVRRVWLRWLQYRVAFQHFELEIMRKYFPADYKRQAAKYRHTPRSPLNRAIEDVAREINKSFDTIRASLREYRRWELTQDRSSSPNASVE